MGIELIELTDKGKDYARSRNSGTKHPELWATIYFIARMGFKTSNDKIATFVFGGDERLANKAIGVLKQKGIVVGE
jgi:hypothetical protein